jgi:CheY-like chemotaxis protein
MTKRRILIVEDNELNRDMLSRRLQRNDFDVSVAADGEEGVALATQLIPDLIIMDLSLPKLDGWAASTMIKQQASTKHVPILALTAHAMDSDRHRAIAAGCDDYDTKPVELARLLEKIQALLKV